jgi:hypothetical protein
MKEEIISSHGICNTEVFIKVTGEDGDFYVLVLKTNAKKHIAERIAGGYQAVKVKLKEVPPCIFKNFTCSDDSYYECRFKDGTDVYFRGDQ